MLLAALITAPQLPNNQSMPVVLGSSMVFAVIVLHSSGLRPKFGVFVRLLVDFFGRGWKAFALSDQFFAIFIDIGT